ncbi:TIGR02117 family protein [Flavobacterium pallidum]|uniref:TIGR02117 family protein n=1 Tax=Flavobacterium pallidum TaxID=2172098 RepID=A0A2S1SJK5_9FLAO|nr:TIGR02117 family protein [Flavobacterium pallidum]AWI26593.1 TIGR02117 family protein [Flavobacterium pallidum]
MKGIIKKDWRFLNRILLYLLGFIILYIALAFIISRIPVNTNDTDNSHDIAIYIRTNGVHTDVVFPLKNSIYDWNKVISADHTTAKDTTLQYAAFGWGDRDFYLNTPEWSDLKAGTAFNAAFYLGTSVMHVVFLDVPKENENCRKIFISRKEYIDMVDFVKGSFQSDAKGNTLPIKGSGYGLNDIFYEAKGKYNLFYTCNSWTNNALKSGRQKAALWTLTDGGIFCHY